MERYLPTREPIHQLLRTQAKLRSQTDHDLQQDLAQEGWLALFTKNMTDAAGELRPEIEIAHAVTIINSAMLDYLRAKGITSQRGRRAKPSIILFGEQDQERGEDEINPQQIKAELIYKMTILLDDDEFAVLLISLGWSDLISCTLEDIAGFLAVRYNSDHLWPITTVHRIRKRAIAKLQ